MVPNPSEIMEEYIASEEEVHLEPQTETIPVAEPEAQGEEQNPAQKERKQKRTEQVGAQQTEGSEDDKEFISDEAYSLWEKNMSDKGFIGEMGFGTLISPFSKIIEKMGWSLFFKHKPPGFATVVREFYANMIDMKEDSIFVRGIWVPMGHERINEVLQIKDPKNGSKYKKLIREPNHEKIVDS